MGAAIALAEIPDFPVIAVRDFDLLPVQAGRIECCFFVGSERRSGANRTFFIIFEIFQAFLLSAVQEMFEPEVDRFAV